MRAMIMIAKTKATRNAPGGIHHRPTGDWAAGAHQASSKWPWYKTKQIGRAKRKRKVGKG
jgi:hypothetical protein